MNFKKIENIIILILWISVLSTFPYVIVSNYSLLFSDYLGLTGLSIITVIAIYKPQKVFGGLFILLILGLFNIVSFIYFVNIVMSFRFAIFETFGIQLLSFVLIIALIAMRGDKISGFFKIIFGRTEKETLDNKTQLKNNFKLKFAKLTDQEIEKKLQTTLVEEASQALIELQHERKNEM